MKKYRLKKDYLTKKELNHLIWISDGKEYFEEVEEEDCSKTTDDWIEKELIKAINEARKKFEGIEERAEITIKEDGTYLRDCFEDKLKIEKLKVGDFFTILSENEMVIVNKINEIIDRLT